MTPTIEIHAGPPIEAVAYSINEFCAAHRISRTTFYELMRNGEAPRTYRVGARTYISRDAACDWQRQREQASAITTVSAPAGHDGRAVVSA
jgi:predicted DNA-binding transcriptional regulator AlpA